MKLALNLIRRLVAGQGAVAAVEFSIIAPVFILLIFGIVCFGILFGTYNCVQQLAAESSRASVAGLSSTERDQLARAYVVQNATAYGLLDPAKLTVVTSSQPTTFTVTVSYDMTNSIIYRLGRILSAVSPVISRSAAIQNGGF